jgi:hypothetical protein
MLQLHLHGTPRHITIVLYESGPKHERSTRRRQIKGLIDMGANLVTADHKSKTALEQVNERDRHEFVSWYYMKWRKDIENLMMVDLGDSKTVRLRHVQTEHIKNLLELCPNFDNEVSDEIDNKRISFVKLCRSFVAYANECGL